MKAARLILFMVSLSLMILVARSLSAIDFWLAGFGRTDAAMLLLLHVERAAPNAAAATAGLLMLFASAGSKFVSVVGAGVVAASISLILIGGLQETARLAPFLDQLPADPSLVHFIDWGTVAGSAALVFAGGFALRTVFIGNAAFGSSKPRRKRGRRAIYGEADWMTMKQSGSIFSEAGGIVIGERYRVDRDHAVGVPFRPRDPQTWGAGGKSPLLCFDGSFGSSHGLVFAGSGGFKTSSVTIPTAITWDGSMVVLDPSGEVEPMVRRQRVQTGRRTMVLDPKHPETGFNVLDWIGRFGSTAEEDIAAVASWIISDSGRVNGPKDDFFRASSLQLLTALIADVCLSGHTPEHDQTLQKVRANMSEPEPKLRLRLEDIYNNSRSTFVRENVAAFVNMTPETFSGVYANVSKETHWLSYPNLAALVSGTTFVTDDVASGVNDVFINIDLKTLENHAGLARLIIGSLLNAIYNRSGDRVGRVLFLLDEVARLGHMGILETARDAGRKYGITLTMMYQSIGQLRESYGGRDASSKWFESASWISFAAVNDAETAEYISRRCGMTTVEVDQISNSSQSKGFSRTRSKQLAARPLILPHEVLEMRADEQIVFTAGNPPLRCGRAIWFRRADMRRSVADNQFHRDRR
ncbi:Ti-type conjugative transfer system protein TraG [Rhizobium cauense]|uniref:Ti-type conjugative transfer system protein TraG n=1 Tax=Rhizobium cauense TaxID=1166683 RepID=UPI001C6DE07D|nr:Ti-type conjugative transfer system protein TraG [Rhizobium cauense]MBW9114783.1 Ti-type conjugative transfer system protein TraG [Rhizobium cauense]